jgi:hypothetical protein
MNRKNSKKHSLGFGALRTNYSARLNRHACFEPLESRQLLSVTLPVIGNQLVRAGAPLNLALNAIGTSATDAITYTATAQASGSQDPKLLATIPTGNTFLELQVDDADDNIHGKMVFELYNDLTPNTVQRITQLVNQPFYDGLTFHRIIEDFMMQGGDPKGDGTGGTGTEFADEFKADLKFTSSGILAGACISKKIPRTSRPPEPY